MNGQREEGGFRRKRRTETERRERLQCEEGSDGREQTSSKQRNRSPLLFHCKKRTKFHSNKFLFLSLFILFQFFLQVSRSNFDCEEKIKQINRRFTLYTFIKKHIDSLFILLLLLLVCFYLFSF